MACYKCSPFNSKYSYLISLEIVAGYRKLRSSRNPGQFKCVLKKQISRTHRGTFNMESLEPRAELARRPRAPWKYSISVGATNFSKYYW